jgi:aminoglycoside N3'-acetyltransferase
VKHRPRRLNTLSGEKVRDQAVTPADVRSVLRDLGIHGQAVCLHSSLKSFGNVIGGAKAIVEVFLSEACTLMVPTYSYWAWTAAPDLPELRPPRNAWDYGVEKEPATRPFSVDSTEVSPDMGAIASAVASWPGRIRGANPGVSFSAIGPRATDLIGGQPSIDPNAPQRALAAMSGWLVLAGVGLERATLLHAAEELAGRNMFMRYALTSGGVVPFATGGCSDGFGDLAPFLEPFRREVFVGESRWWIFPAAEMLKRASDAIRANPNLTRCTDPTCARCESAIEGGPILASPWRGGS